MIKSIYFIMAEENDREGEKKRSKLYVYRPRQPTRIFCSDTFVINFWGHNCRVHI